MEAEALNPIPEIEFAIDCIGLGIYSYLLPPLPFSLSPDLP